MGDFIAGCVNHVSSKLLFRRKEANYLVRLFGPRVSYACQSIFIYGHSSTGKTCLLYELLQELQVPYAWVNCREMYTPRLLFLSLTQKLVSSNTLNFKASEDKLCDNLSDFIYFLKKNATELKETFYLVFDDAEVLRKKEPSVLCSLLRLQELVNANVSCIFISAIIWEKFRTGLGMCFPITVYFRDYNKDELLEMLSHDCPSDYSKDFYASYIKVVLSMFFIVTRNLRELRHLAAVNFPRYCEPVKSGKIPKDDVHKLWKNIESVLKDALQTVYLREISGWNFLRKKTVGEIEECSVNNSLRFNDDFASYHMTTELPFYSKFLLMASYVASYNPPSTDHKFFVKNRSKKRKRISKKNQVNIHLLGPKVFVLDRMLAIFYAVVEDGVPPSALIFSQISSLVSLRLIMCVSPDDQLSLRKYKCTAELALVRSIGRTVNFDIMSYLHDFN